MEYKINRSWSAKIEYLHVDLGGLSGTANTIAGPLPISSKVSFDTVRAGLNFSF